MRNGISEAVATYNRDHAREWPESGAKCPMCGHGGCFGRLPKAPKRWCCFSENHGQDSGGRGIRGSKVWHGDALDVDAHEAKLSRADLLRREGYLEASEPDVGAEDDPLGDGRPVIIVTTDIPDIVDQGEAALVASCKDHLYERGGVLVRVVRNPGRRTPGLRRPPRAPRAEAISDASLLELLSKHAIWVAIKRGKEEPVLPPGWAVKVLAARGTYRLRSLEGIVETPVLRPDGTVLDTPGYDEETGLIYAPSVEYPPIPAQPTRADAERALATLLGPLEEFPFVDDSDRAAAVASVLTIVARHAIEGPTPLFAMLAHTPGTGKSLLVTVVTLIATGNQPAFVTAFQEDEELRKLLTAVILEGQRALVFDNAEGTFGSGVLAGALTSTDWSGRVLGVSRTVRAPLITVMFVTGNNLGFVGDTHRRVVPVFLDAGIENPEERTFKRPHLIKFVRENRPRLLAAALTIHRAYEVAGRPPHPFPPMGSYEAWDERVRGCVMWLMGADPIAGRQKIRREASGEIEQMRVLLRATFAAFEGRAVTAVDMLQRAEHDDALLSAIRGIDAVRAGERIGAQPLGYALRRWAGRVVGGFRLERAGEARSGVLWRVVRAGGPPNPPPEGPGAGGRPRPGGGGCGDRGDCDPRPAAKSGETDGGGVHRDAEAPHDEGESLRNLRSLRADPPAEGPRAGAEDPSVPGAPAAAWGRCPDGNAPLSAEASRQFGGICRNCRMNREFARREGGR